MKVLHVTNAWPNAAHPIKGIFIREQVEALRQLGLEVSVQIIDGSQGKTAYVKAAAELCRKKSSFDIVHAHHVLTGTAAVSAGLGRGKLVVSFLNNRGTNILRAPGWVSRSMERFVASRTAVNIFKNDSFGDIRRPSDAVIPNAVDPVQFLIIDKSVARQTIEIEGGGARLLFVSANDLDRPAKRRDRFLEIHRMLTERGFACEPLYLSNQSRERVPYYFNAADVLVVTSNHEGSPNAVKEALAVGLPVVATRVGDVPEQMRGVPDCHIVDPYDVDGFCRRIEGVISSPAASREERRNRYLVQASKPLDVARQLLAIYERVRDQRDNEAK